MAKNVTLEEGADALVIRSANSKTVKSIPYGAITQLDKKVAPTLSGNSVIPDYITVKADGKETIIFHKDVVSPVTTNVHTLFSTVWGWVYTDTAPTLAPTTAAPTT